MKSDMKRRLKVVDDSSSCGDDSSEEVDQVPGRSIQEVFRHYWIPMFITLFFEAWMVYAMTTYINAASLQAVNVPGAVEDPQGLEHGYWFVFIGCILGRIASVLAWKFGKATVWPEALFIFFSTIQWVYYLVAYYVVREALMGIGYLDNLMSDTGAKQGMGVLARCIDEFGIMGCKNLTRPVFGCAKEYNSVECTGYALVGANQTKCCVKTSFYLYRIHETLDFGFWKPTCEQFFTIIRWTGALAVKWVLEKNPLMAGTSLPFLQASTIDIMDSIMFSAYLNSDVVLLPKNGIVAGQPVHPNGRVFFMLLFTVTLAFTTSMLSPFFFVLCFPRQGEVAKVGPRNFSAALKDLTESLRKLKQTESKKLLEEAFALQLAAYKKEADKSQHAVIVTEDASSDEEEALKFNAAMAEAVSTQLMDAVMQREDKKQKQLKGIGSNLGNGMYRVQLDEGGCIEVGVHQVRADLDRQVKSQSFTPISGVCGGLPEGFDNRAQIFDSARSLLCLELPFLLWRLYFELAAMGLMSVSIILVLKNFLWGLNDFLTLISCGNQQMTVFGYQPLATLNTIIKGSAMSSVFVGPVGFVRVAADVATNSVKSKLADQQHQLECQIAWLLVEREACRGKDGSLDEADPGVQRFNASIAQVEREMAVIQREIDMVHQ